MGRTSPLIWPCSDWGLPCRCCCQHRGGLLPHLFTLTTGAYAQVAVYFLWPDPSPLGAQALPGSLPIGARTFLGTEQPARDHPANPGTKVIESGVFRRSSDQGEVAFRLLDNRHKFRVSPAPLIDDRLILGRGGGTLSGSLERLPPEQAYPRE